jgi:hypothetical protein
VLFVAHLQHRERFPGEPLDFCGSKYCRIETLTA